MMHRWDVRQQRWRLARALIFLRRCVVVDRGPWYPWAFKRISYFHQTFGERNRG